MVKCWQILEGKLNERHFMKSLTGQGSILKNYHRLYAALTISAWYLCKASAPAAPRPPLPPIPEFASQLYHESFDASFSSGITNAQVIKDQFTYDESWSGYALQRVGDVVLPYVVPALDFKGRTNVSCSQGTIRFWFKPAWTSAATDKGIGPGTLATLLELDAVGKGESANAWSLQISPDGNTLSLVAQSDNNPMVLLETGISWSANRSHLVWLNYGPKETTVFLDGQIVAQGTGTPTVPPEMAALVVGSSLAGKAVAGGDFDELACYDSCATRNGELTAQTLDVSFYWNYCADYAALGPISAEEIAAREKRLAENKNNPAFAQRSSAMMSGMSARNTCGPLDASACVTNGAVFMTNVWAELETNGTMTVTFDLVGGTNATGLFYDIFTTTNLADGNVPALSWTWLARGPTCQTYQFTNQPLAAAFYMVGTPQDTDGDGMSDAFERLVSRTDPLVGENRIQTENAITGTTNWMLFNPITADDNHGWPLSDGDTLPEIQGFAAETSVNVGDTIDLYVDVRATNNPAATNYTLEIFRLGWYGGQGGRQMTWNDSGARTNVTLLSHIQPVPKMNSTNGLIDCLSGWTTNGVDPNRMWRKSYTLTVPTNWVSGVYVARLTTGTNVTPQTTGKQSYIIFTVREDARTSELLCQASVTTWQAYNPYGGKSMYVYPNGRNCNDDLNPNELVLSVVAVSFNRPYAAPSCIYDPLVSLTYGSGAGEFFTMINKYATPAWEYNMVRWLERQGYDVTYCTSVDTHQNCPANRGVKTFLSVGHDEYWSVPQRAHVEAARDRGVNLTFFAANACYHRIIYEADGRSFSEDRTGINGLWRGPIVNNPEISMIGVEYVSNYGFEGSVGIEMPTTLPSGSGIGGKHWAYDYSGLTNHQSLPGLLGQEIDGCWDVNSNACENVGPSDCPSSTTIKLADSVFTSCVKNGITNTGHSYVTLYTACGGAQVFATDAWQWIWGLDDFAYPLVRPRTSRVHLGAQQMTHNVFRNFSGRTTALLIFTNADAITSGNWPASYGTNYLIANTLAFTNLPSYAQVTFTNEQIQVWANPSTDPRALLIPGSTNRIASAWTTTNLQGSSFTMDVNLTGTNVHQVALYCVDWLGTGSVLQKVEVFDYADLSHPLDTRSFQLPPNGVYLTWKLKGHNIFRITKPDATTGNKAMVSGLFIKD